MSAPRRYRHLLLPVDRGELTLPDDVLTARAGLARLDTALATITGPPPAQEVFDAAVQAALTADQPATLDVAAVLDHDRQEHAHAARLAVLRTAHNRADTAFRAVIADAAETIVGEHLRPAGEELWETVTSTVKTLGAINTDRPDALLAAPDKTRRAWLALDGHAATYARLRAALGELLRDDPPEHDVRGDHAEFEHGLCRIIGPAWTTTPTSPQPHHPWPTDERGRVIWIARAGHVPWWPLPADRDAAWMDAHRDAHEQQQHRNALHRQAHGRVSAA